MGQFNFMEAKRNFNRLEQLRGRQSRSGSKEVALFSSCCFFFLLSDVECYEDHVILDTVQNGYVYATHSLATELGQMLDCLIMQIADQPITRQKRDALRHVVELVLPLLNV